MTDHHDDSARETPSQGIFIGWLGFGLLIFALCFAAFGIIAGASHGWQ